MKNGAWIWGGALAALSVMAAESCKTTAGAALTGTDTEQTSSSTGGNDGLTCASYCNKIMANCTVDNQQYTNQADCLASCAAFPAGEVGAENGNSVGCRTYHAGAAQADPATHCIHAGPGGDGVCGAPCVGYCEIALSACTGDNKVYDDPMACQSACKSRKTDVAYSVGNGFAGGNQLACLLFYVQEAAGAPDDHCADLAEATTPCRDGLGGAGGAGAGGAGGGGGAGGT